MGSSAIAVQRYNPLPSWLLGTFHLEREGRQWRENKFVVLKGPWHTKLVILEQICCYSQLVFSAVSIYCSNLYPLTLGIADETALVHLII